MEWLNLETSLTIIGSIAAIATTVALYIYKLRSDKSAERAAFEVKFDNIHNKLDELIKKIDSTEDKLHNVNHSALEKEFNQKLIKEELERIKQEFESNQSELKKETRDRFEKVEQKIEKFSDVIMKFLSSNINDKD